ncbi:hypothetical protein BGW41_007277 [Actinomortierella wolfii]|nr:hypothetical protein BGW41_007277 [Actinomortierella wolfii]
MNSNLPSSGNQNSDNQHPAGSSLTDTVKKYADKAMAMGHQYYEHAKEQLSHLQHGATHKTDHATTQASSQANPAATSSDTTGQSMDTSVQQNTGSAFSDIDQFNRLVDQSASTTGNQTGASLNDATQSAQKAVPDQQHQL